MENATEDATDDAKEDEDSERQKDGFGLLSGSRRSEEEGRGGGLDGGRRGVGQRAESVSEDLRWQKEAGSQPAA